MSGMKISLIVLALALVAGIIVLGTRPEEPAAAVSPAMIPSAAPVAVEVAEEDYQGFLYGRVTTVGGAIYVGRLRWGGDEEVFWGDTFQGFKDENPWVAEVPSERLPRERRSIEIFGLEIAKRDHPIDLRRPFTAWFGDVGRIEAGGRELRVTLKSGTVVALDRLSASDFDDGVRVWADGHGVVDLDSLRIRTIEFLPTARLGTVPSRLHGTVRTGHGDFTGFIQWNRQKSVGSDELDGHTTGGELSVRLDAVRSIARNSRDSSRVTLLDGRQIVLSDTRDVGRGNRGIYVDDRRYGRVLISWDAFERADFSAAGSGPAYGDFPPGRPLTGSVATRAGRRLTGRLVFDLDESETTETLDAPSEGVDYTIPFGLVASIVPGREECGTRGGGVILHSGEELQLECAGDLGEGNAGMLIFVDGRERPEYLPWADVERIDFNRGDE